MELLEERLECSCCRPAFIVAAAWRETDADRGEPVGDSARGAGAASPLEAMRGRYVLRCDVEYRQQLIDDHDEGF